MGHTCYVIDDKIVISGDCLAINQNGGYCFFKLFNMNTKMNIQSLHKLKNKLSNYDLKMVCTRHNGYSIKLDTIFKNIDKIATSTKSNPFDKNAPYDLFD